MIRLLHFGAMGIAPQYIRCCFREIPPKKTALLALSWIWVPTVSERGRRTGLDVELIPPERTSRLKPFLKPTGVVPAMRIGDDRYFDPAQVAVGYARAAAARGMMNARRESYLSVSRLKPKCSCRSRSFSRNCFSREWDLPEEEDIMLSDATIGEFK
jgi:hypothetical protein